MAAVWPDGWSSAKKVTISCTNVDDALTDFPLLTKRVSDSDMSEARSDGYDYRIRLDGSAVDLKYEREAWSGGGGAAASFEIWNRITSISAVADTICYVFYGNAGAADGEDAANVWDANFKGVWHCSEDAANLIDSTGGAHTATRQGDPVQQDGAVYKAQDLDGTGDYFSVADHADLEGMAAITVEAWVKFGSMSDDSEDTIVSKWSTNAYTYCFRYDSSDNELDWIIGNGGNYIGISNGVSIEDSAWHHVAGVLESDDDIIAYLDGSPLGVTDTFSYSIGVNGEAVEFGNSPHAASDILTGGLDEIRISDSGRAPEWLKFVFHNIHEADNELTWGAEESAAAGLSIPVAMRHYRGLRV